MKRFLMLMVAIVLCAWSAQAVTLRALTAQEKIATGADYLVILTHADLTNTNASTAQTVALMTVGAKQGVEFKAMALKTAFVDTDSQTTNNTLTVTVGDGNSATKYMASTELCADGTEVFLKFPQADTATATTTVTPALQRGTFATAITLEKGTISYLNHSTNQVTMSVVTNATLTTSALAVTNVTATAATTVTVTGNGSQLYTGSDTVDAFVTPKTAYAVSAMDAGEVWFYFRVWDVTYPSN